MNALIVNELMLGAIAMGFFVAGLFFLRFAVHSKDRLFLFFAFSFWIEAAGRIYLGLNASWSEDSPAFYLVRLLAYGLILFGVWDKNRPLRE
jgi:hypothetical protein